MKKTVLACALTLVAIGAAPSARAGNSTDYPGPCQNEQTVPGTPLYISADYHGTNPDARIIVMPAVGRFRFGISCVGTGFFVVRIGPGSALCTWWGKCSPEQITEADLNWVGMYYPQELPFMHRCEKHGFGWYDAVGVQPGVYLAAAKSGSAYWGFVDGHGTMDTYAYYGNNGAFQPVNCPPPGYNPLANTVCGQVPVGTTCGSQSCNDYFANNVNCGAGYRCRPAETASSCPYSGCPTLQYYRCYPY